MKSSRISLLLFASLFALSALASERHPGLEQGFLHPPASARPWVYWFWLNGNITSNGITADLEAMQRAGIGGVLIMEVDQGAPKGPAAFGTPPWRQLFKHVCAEAHRLDLQVNMNNDAGWCGSGGPWITPDLAMQKVVWSETQVEGPRHFAGPLPQPKAVANYYRDIAVLAFPTPAGKARLNGIQAKAAFTPTFIAPQADFPSVPSNQTIPPGQIVELTSRLDASGKLTWDVPRGKWTILRFGHTPTGKDNHPAPEAGRGLECDKLNPKAADTMFNGLMAKLIADSKPLAGKTLVSTHIDSWEVGSQNWTPRLRHEFRARRGYDPLPFLPVLTARIVESSEVSERFLWDLRQTISELVLENYAGRFRQLAHRHGLRLSIEAYTHCPVDELAYAGRADEPMGEFWSWRKYMEAFSCTEMASAAHVYGKRIVGAEAFTATDAEKWLGYPGNIKDLGDWAFCEGINRFVFHRYALQPWDNVRPGMSMGPWGLHYERTQTWWEQSRAWHDYLARCQFLLQQGLFVADICLLSPEGSPQTIARQKSFLSQTPGSEGQPFERPGHNFDLCPPEVVLNRMSVKHGRLVLPDGMSYRLLALSQSQTMTPQLLRKLKDLVHAGATIAGARPLKSPSLSGYPACDTELRTLADELWGPAEPAAGVTARRYGKGLVISGKRFEQARDANRCIPNRLGSANWIWFKEGNPAVAVPVGPRFFRRLVTVETASALDSAHLLLTADNSFQCWVNGRRAGAGDDYTRLYDLDIAPLLKPGTNLVAVTAVNGADQPNPAGLIGMLTLKYHDGRTVHLPTDSAWQSAATVHGAWHSDVTLANAWLPAMQLGQLGMAPWGDITQNGSSADLYPDIAWLGQLLDQRGVPPDFSYQAGSATRSLRYIHKRIGRTDLYFVANKTPQPEEALCSFRVQGKRPEFWRPDTGRIERPAVYDETADCVRVPMRFEPCGSVFVVFREKTGHDRQQIVAVTQNGQPVIDAKTPSGAGAGNGAVELALRQGGQVSALAWQPGKYKFRTANGRSGQFEVPSLPPPLQISGPWKVQFASGCGAPPQLTFDKLISWSDHPDPGVKYFSGTATYSKSLMVPPELVAKGRRWYLDLGKVAVMAQVTLNGKDLGTLWKAPYRVEVTDAIRPGENLLEARVVNLWVNRLIGDEQLPEDSERNPNGTLKQWPQWLLNGQPSPAGRCTFTSWRLWKKDSPLQPSGLLGPVQLVPACELLIAKP